MRARGFTADEHSGHAKFRLRVFEHPVRSGGALGDHAGKINVGERGVVDADNGQPLLRNAGVDAVVHGGRTDGPAAAVEVDVNAAHFAGGKQDAKGKTVAAPGDASRRRGHAGDAVGHESLCAQHGLDHHLAEARGRSKARRPA